MKRAAIRRHGQPALELVEAAVRLLRAAPAGALLAYYAGTAPCVLGLLYFLADMSHGAFARRHLFEAALGAAGLYVWMKCWHAVFAAKLRAHLLMEPENPWTAARIARLVLVQTAVQPTGLFVRLLAAQVLLPYVWTYSFYQNVGILGDGTEPGFGVVVRDAVRQARLWPRQAHVALLQLFGFGLLVWINVTAVIAGAPWLLKIFLGIESMVTRDPWVLLNTTLLAATLAATYLCIDPIRKAVFVLRCFQGASLHSGDDLRVGLKTLRHRALAAAALLLIGLAGFAPSLRAEEPPPTVQVESGQLSESLDQVLQRREFAWRLPAVKDGRTDEEKGWLATFLETLWKRLRGLVRTAFDWMEKIREWFRKTFHREPKPGDTGDSGGRVDWPAVARVTFFALLGGLVVLLGVMLWRHLRGRRPHIVAAQPLPAVPDLNADDVTADQLPEDGWLTLARDLMQSGQLRLALRASYLASLAHLGHRDFIRLARHKSNRDYDRELQRRARAQPELLTAFDRNLCAFERSWYGEHEVTAETLGDFAQNLDRIRAC